MEREKDICVCLNTHMTGSWENIYVHLKKHSNGSWDDYYSMSNTLWYLHKWKRNWNYTTWCRSSFVSYFVSTIRNDLINKHLNKLSENICVCLKTAT